MNMDKGKCISAFYVDICGAFGTIKIISGYVLGTLTHE